MAVVVGFIPTEVGFKALTAAREEAEQRGGPLIVVNVLREGVTDPLGGDRVLEQARVADQGPPRAGGRPGEPAPSPAAGSWAREARRCSTSAALGSLPGSAI